MLSSILTFFASSAFASITDKLSEAYQMKLNAENNEQRIEAEEAIAHWKLQQQLVLAEQGKWYTSWIRPALAFPVVIFTWKLLIWDTVLQMGTTPYPGDFVLWIVMTVIGAYMISRPIEKALGRR